MGWMKKIGTITADSKEIADILSEHPDYPITFCVDEDVCGQGDFNSAYSNNVYVGVLEILDADMPDSNYICDDRDDFEYRIENWLVEKMNKERPGWTEEELEEELKKEKAKYDPYWKNVIAVSVCG